MAEMSHADANKSREECSEQSVEIDPEFLENQKLFSSNEHENFAKLANETDNEDNSL